MGDPVASFSLGVNKLAHNDDETAGHAHDTTGGRTGSC